MSGTETIIGETPSAGVDADDFHQFTLAGRASARSQSSPIAAFCPREFFVRHHVNQRGEARVIRLRASANEFNVQVADIKHWRARVRRRQGSDVFRDKPLFDSAHLLRRHLLEESEEPGIVGPYAAYDELKIVGDEIGRLRHGLSLSISSAIALRAPARRLAMAASPVLTATPLSVLAVPARAFAAWLAALRQKGLRPAPVREMARLLSSWVGRH